MATEDDEIENEDMDFDEEMEVDDDFDLDDDFEEDEVRDFSSSSDDKKKKLVVAGAVAGGIVVLFFIFNMLSSPAEPVIESISEDNSQMVNQNRLSNQDTRQSISRQESIPLPNLTDTQMESSKDSFAEISKKLTTAKPAPEIKMQDNNRSEGKVHSSKMEHSNSMAISSVEKNLNHLSEEVNVNASQVMQMKDIMVELRSSLIEVNNTLSNMDNRIYSISSTVGRLSDELENVQKVIKDEDLDLTSGADKMQEGPLTYSAPEYAVHAIIPGRAWLKTDGGQIITITEGDSIGDYGTVAAIDATNGIVRTSSGVTFR